jgi:hypothetical protein
LNLGFGFPAVVMVAPHKNKMATMKAAFTKDSFSDFLNSVISGRVGLEDVTQKL